MIHICLGHLNCESNTVNKNDGVIWQDCNHGGNQGFWAGNLLEPTDVVNPSITISWAFNKNSHYQQLYYLNDDSWVESDDPDNCISLVQTKIEGTTYADYLANYVYIYELNRYYFIKNIKLLGNQLYQLDLHVDVLYTYKSILYDSSTLMKFSRCGVSSYFSTAMKDNMATVTNKVYNRTIKYIEPMSWDSTSDYNFAPYGCWDYGYLLGSSYPNIVVGLRNRDIANLSTSTFPNNNFYVNNIKVFNGIGAASTQFQPRINVSNCAPGMGVSYYVLGANINLPYLLRECMNASNAETLTSSIASITAFPFAFTPEQMKTWNPTSLGTPELTTLHFDNNLKIEGVSLGTVDEDGYMTGYKIAGNVMRPVVHSYFKPSDLGYSQANWYDLPPYTKYDLWIPYYGWVDLDLCARVDHTICLYYIWDLLGQSGTAVLYDETDNDIVWQAQCQIGIAIPWDSTSQNEIDAKRDYINTQIATSTISGALMTALGAVMCALPGPSTVMGAMLMVSGISTATSGIASGVVQQEQLIPTNSQVGVTSGFTSAFQPSNIICRVTKYYIYPLISTAGNANQTNYVKMVGHPSASNVTGSSTYETSSNWLGAFTSLSHINFTPADGMTSTEADEFESLLKGGFHW